MKLHIPTPCHEDWQKMTPSEKGRFCQSCQTEVQDFTRLSDREILERVRQNSGKSLCGHFRQDQLGRKLHTPRKPIAWPKWLFGGMAALFASQPLSAQTKNENAAPVVQMRPVADRLQAKQNETVRYTGRVFDQKSGAPIALAKVEIKGKAETYTTETNHEGRFDIRLHNEEVAFRVIISAEGYITHSLEVSFNNGGANSQIYLSPGADEFWVNGRVKGDGYEEGIPFVNVVIAGTQIGTQTDIEGSFKLLIPENLENPKLIFSAIGFEKQELTASQNMLVHIKEDEMVLQGAVITGYMPPQSRVQAAWWRVKSFFRFRWLRRYY